MAIKLDLPPFWDRVSGGLYSAASVRLRTRLLSEAGLLPRRHEPLTDLHKARFLIGLYASVPHVGAVDAAKEVSALDNPIHEAGPELAWGRLYGQFEVVLTRIVEDLRLGRVWMPYGKWELLEVSICSSRPEASIAVNTGAPDSTAYDEAYRWSEGALRQRFRRGFLDTRAIPGSAVRALACIDFADDESGDTVARHEAKNAETLPGASAFQADKSTHDGSDNPSGSDFKACVSSSANAPHTQRKGPPNDNGPA